MARTEEATRTVEVSGIRLVADTAYRWTIPREGAMRVPGVVFASKALLPSLQGDQSVRQVVNVATLPGIVGASYAMPDIHWGYGFPIGGVAATDVDEGGVVSPGGVGFDISCGVRLLASEIPATEVRPRIAELMGELYKRVPVGAGGGGIWQLSSRAQVEQVLAQGAEAAVAAGFGTAQDLARCEDQGALQIEDFSGVSERAIERGRGQLGSLGSGNHFLEVQMVERIFDPQAAVAFGLVEGCVTVMVHSGSRGLGHQVCSDHVEKMLKTMPRYGISVPDPQLACAPVRSREGESYLAAMTASANFGRANRQVMSSAARQAFAALFPGCELSLVYDVSHNLAKIERHFVAGAERELCVHRKGATRALPPGHQELPEEYRGVGQPVLVPGSMGSASYVLVGAAGGEAFHSTCHGSGRVMSRHQAMKRSNGKVVLERMTSQGIYVAARSLRALPEEMPEAYKDVEAVVATCEGAGLSRPVARLWPLGVLKG
jgi:tRNA-splicing ligase RtcB